VAGELIAEAAGNEPVGAELKQARVAVLAKGAEVLVDVRAEAEHSKGDTVERAAAVLDAEPGVEAHGVSRRLALTKGRGDDDDALLALSDELLRVERVERHHVDHKVRRQLACQSMRKVLCGTRIEGQWAARADDRSRRGSAYQSCRSRSQRER
jgi:hypothetical protein